LIFSSPMQKSFIETQFPISKLSKESYKERKAVQSQTLTGLDKWWGRKPLVLVRAAIMGLLVEATNNPKKDREIFLKLLTMDDEGLWQRKSRLIPPKDIYFRATPRERKEWFDTECTEEKPKYKKGLNAEQKEAIQKTVFMRMSYDEKLTYCDRPEQIDGPSEKAWQEINAYLGTNATNIVELVQELGIKKFSHIPTVGDAFCGGGSIPFEAARIGCKAYGSDLNPVGALLTWASLNIIGGGLEVAKQVQKAQKEVYDAVDKQITEWGIEHNEKGWRADAYLYCNEVICPECGWKVPLAPSWVIGEKTKCVAKLIPDPRHKRFDIKIESGISDDEMKEAKKAGTATDSYLVCPNPKYEQKTPIAVIRGDRSGEYGLRMWENDDIVPRANDVFQERLYCIRWVETYLDDEGKVKTKRYYMAPDENDLRREQKVLELLKERFSEWQEKGYIPSRKIESGPKTDEPIRTRGWTHWHHLFNPRQLLNHGLLKKRSFGDSFPKIASVVFLLGTGRCCDWNSKLAKWDSSAANEKGSCTFVNQALNTLSNHVVRSLPTISTNWFLPLNNSIPCQHVSSEVSDARKICYIQDIWITDPPYADAINYHELSEFFLAWYEKHLQKLFPAWYTDSKRALAVVGSDENFRKSMVDCYRNIANYMPDDGMQIVMFTHQDARVWADLALILWASGLRVTSAWCIATETESALKEGNYVQGTVLLVLRKQTLEETAFLDEIYSQIETEVEEQLREYQNTNIPF
jgi:putative DNA methylase